MAVDAGADILRHLALQKLRRRGRELDHLHAALDLALGIGQDLAVLLGDDGGERIDTLLEEVQEAVEDTRAAERGRAGPARRRGLRRRDRGLHLGRAAEPHGTDRLAGRRIEHRLRRP